ncbi:peptidylprolyl isomerase [Bacteroides sp. 51]|nr:peptidylprolyl isomerase [Bacteroides sp. 51]
MLFLFMSCSESEDPGKYVDWRERNEAFIDSLQQVFDLKLDSELKALIYQRDKRYTIYYKVMKSIPEGQPPFYTSTVHYYYREMLIDEAVFNASPAIGYYTKLYKHLDILKSNIKDDNSLEFSSPRKFDVKEFETDAKEIAAYTEVMQHMKTGER